MDGRNYRLKATLKRWALTAVLEVLSVGPFLSAGGGGSNGTSSVGPGSVLGPLGQHQLDWSSLSHAASKGC